MSNELLEDIFDTGFKNNPFKNMLHCYEMLQVTQIATKLHKV